MYVCARDRCRQDGRDQAADEPVTRPPREWWTVNEVLETEHTPGILQIEGVERYWLLGGGIP